MIDKKQKNTTNSVLAIGTLLVLTGCVANQTEPVSSEAGNGSTQYQTKPVAERELNKKPTYDRVDNKRFFSGPYGAQEEILNIASEIQQRAKPVNISSRNIVLPNKPIYINLKGYSYTLPSACGGLSFTFYKNEFLQILEYNHKTANNKSVKIRDYISANNPFVTAGLWGPYDHTAKTALNNVLRSSGSSSNDDDMGLLRSEYNVGWVTTISESQQLEIGLAYANAITSADTCLKQDIHWPYNKNGQTKTAPEQTPVVAAPADATTAKTYTVQRGDTLSDISKLFFKNIKHWQSIYQHNADVIGENPALLKPGLVLQIPEEN